MRKHEVMLGEKFYKAGRPRIVWAVERFNSDTRIAHVVLTKVDDPTTKITISTEALSDRLYFRRSTTSEQLAS